MSSSGGLGFGVGVGVGVAGGPTLAAAQQGQGVAALLVMLAVLCFIFAYCCWGAPFCRSLCRRHCCCRLEDPELESRFSNNDQAVVATPTIILLPHGRMLVVDGTIFTQFQTDPTGEIRLNLHIGPENKWPTILAIAKSKNELIYFSDPFA